jgi:hypothetical protein
MFKFYFFLFKVAAVSVVLLSTFTVNANDIEEDARLDTVITK